MKKVAVARNILVALCALGIGAPGARAGDLEDVVAKHLVARGGLDKIRAVHSAVITGKMKFPGAGMEAPLVMKWKAPNKLRSEFTFQGMTAIQAFDGEKGWGIMPFQGSADPEPISADELKQVEDQADFTGPFVDTEKKGYKLEYLGQGEVEATPVHNIKVTNRHGETTLIHIDAESMLEIRSEQKRKIQGQDIELEVSQGDYRDVGGIMFAHSYEAKPKGMPAGQTVVFDKIELNPEIPDADFAMPAPKPAQKPAE